MSILDDLGRKYGSDKSSISWLSYLHHYERHFCELREKPISLLEIGIYFGSSGLMWHEYFKNASITMVDVDNTPERINPLLSLDRMRVVIGDITKNETLAAIKSNYDIIIDDASHKWSHQIKTFEALFDSLNSGGIYIIEDLHTSFIDDFNDYEVNTVDFMCGKIRDLCCKQTSSKSPYASIEFIKSCCIIKKK